MQKAISIRAFRRAILALPSDKPKITPKKWYKTQKEHWLGWLHDYKGPGAYGRLYGKNRDARFVYNHVVQPEMLLWLIRAAGVKPSLIARARHSSSKKKSLIQKSAAIRMHVPWTEVENMLWKSTTTTARRNYR